MHKSVDKSRELPSPSVIAELIALRATPPRVLAQDVARELGVTPSQVSLFENAKEPLPNGIGPESYRTAVRRIRERRGEAVVGGAA